jgi:hypothetical protein
MVQWVRKNSKHEGKYSGEGQACPDWIQSKRTHKSTYTQQQQQQQQQKKQMLLY